MVLCVGFSAPGPRRARARALLAASTPALAVLALYLAVFTLNDGRYLGIANMSGWNLYARAAPFADCSRFTPPPGTGRLCEKTPTAQRVGSLGYVWDTESIGRRSFELGPETSPVVGGFAREAIAHQPLSYLKAVATDAARYAFPGIGPDRPQSGQPRDVLSFGRGDPEVRETMEKELARGYTGTGVSVHGRGALATYQDLFRVGGLLLVAMVVLTLVGMAVARGAVRLGVFLFGLAALALYLVPVLTLSYEVRYGLPPQPFVVASGALGLAALLDRRVGLRP